MRKYGKRVWHFHFKDHEPEVRKQAAKEGWDYFQAVKNGVFCELGKGDVNFPAIMKQLQELSYDGWGVVEQDVLPGMGAPKESARAQSGIHPHAWFLVCCPGNNMIRNASGPAVFWVPAGVARSTSIRTDTGASLAPWPAPKPQAARIMLFRDSTLAI